MQKAHNYVLLPIDEKRHGILDSQATVQRFANRWGMKLVTIKEPQFTNIYWNAAMRAYLKRPRGYLRTHAVYVALANSLLAARKAAEAWVRWLNQTYQMKPESAAIAALIRPRCEADEEK